VIAAGLGPPFVNGAATPLFIEIDTVVVGPAGQGKERVLKVEMVDGPGLKKLPGQHLGRLNGLKGIDASHPHQILDLYLHRQPATPALTVGAEAFSVSAPGFGPGDVGRIAIPLSHFPTSSICSLVFLKRL
jgi:hypothetical protein